MVSAGADGRVQCMLQNGVIRSKIAIGIEQIVHSFPIPEQYLEAFQSDPVNDSVILKFIMGVSTEKERPYRPIVRLV
ncbi:hypothetical protein GCM10027347_34560 [Larkinella harenae]